jgi:uncharacterized protein (DUF58 family)
MNDWNGVETSLLTRLEKYRLKPRKSHAGHIRGERLSPKKGISIEFADYRHYAAGDDLRHLDWNVLARLDRAHIRTYRDEEELPVYLLLDMSASMDFGSPPKHHLARSLAAAMGYIGLCGSDAVYPVALTGRAAEIRALRGRGSYRRLLEWLRALQPAGSELSDSLKRFAHASPRAGMVIIFSDGLDPDFPDALRTLAGRRHEVSILQILSEVDLEPDLEGDLRLIDVESESAIEITATSGVLLEYQKRLQSHCEAIESACKRLGAWYVRVQNNQPLENTLLKQLRHVGVIGS